MTDNRRQSYIEWVTGLDTEPPLEGAFNAGWLARDPEVERLQTALERLKDYVAGQATFTMTSQGWYPQDGSLALELEAAEAALGQTQG